MPRIGSGKSNDGSIVVPMAIALALVVALSLTTRVSPFFT